MSSIKFASAVAFAGFMAVACSSVPISSSSASSPNSASPADGDTYAYDHVRVFTSTPMNATTVTSITACGVVTPTKDGGIPSEFVASLKCQAFILGGNAVVLGDRYFVGESITAVDDDGARRTTTTPKGYEIVKATVIKTLDTP